MAKRLRTWLFIACLLVAGLGPVAVGAVNHLLDARFQTLNPIQPLPTPSAVAAEAVCTPDIDPAALAALEALVLNQDSDPQVSARMAELFAADQAVRQLPVAVEAVEIVDGDTQRRIEVLGYILQGQIHAPRDLVYAAFVFQHGDCPGHYAFAHRLATFALDVGYDEARWIYAATLDRYLMSLGQPQKYGTQYTWEQGAYKLYPVDPATTDAERAEYNLPPLSVALQQVPGGGSGNVVRGRWLESWWLTLIGSAYAALGALIALCAGRANPPLGRFLLVLACLIYILSSFGHVLQVAALQSGGADVQAQLWAGVNVVLVAVWCFCAVYLAWIRPWQLRRLPPVRK